MTALAEMTAADDVRPPEYTDDALALQLAEDHGQDLRYVAKWGQWYIWDGARWAEDSTLHVFDLARAICRYKSFTCSNEMRIAKALASAQTVAAVERLAKSDRAIAATTDDWDRDEWLLNTPAGIIDLTTGELGPHRRDALMTKLTAVSPEGECPLWITFLERVTGADVELQAYLKRLVGYALTGSTREHVLPFAYGTGANGKSVFINTVAGILGDYHKTAPIETFTLSSHERHPTELAGLRGARLVTATETEEGRRWAESRIKALTGGDTISARFMRQDFFEYRPTFKLFVAGNHKPGLRSVDEAIRRRFNLIPFAVTIPEHERDDTLSEKLKSEWPGILKWAVEGCLEWQGQGLGPPQVILDATAAYLNAEDALSAWIDESCQREPDSWEGSGALFQSWKRWAERAGEYVGTQRKFSQTLEARGFEPHRKNKLRGFNGLRLTDMPEPDFHWG